MCSTESKASFSRRSPQPINRQRSARFATLVQAGSLGTPSPLREFFAYAQSAGPPNQMEDRGRLRAMLEKHPSRSSDAHTGVAVPGRVRQEQARSKILGRNLPLASYAHRNLAQFAAKA